jgi:hypothetical protein
MRLFDKAGGVTHGRVLGQFHNDVLDPGFPSESGEQQHADLHGGRLTQPSLRTCRSVRRERSVRSTLLSLVHVLTEVRR